jgi:hypothetical protein
MLIPSDELIDQALELLDDPDTGPVKFTSRDGYEWEMHQEFNILVIEGGNPGEAKEVIHVNLEEI